MGKTKGQPDSLRDSFRGLDKLLTRAGVEEVFQSLLYPTHVDPSYDASTDIVSYTVEVRDSRDGSVHLEHNTFSLQVALAERVVAASEPVIEVLESAVFAEQGNAVAVISTRLQSLYERWLQDPVQRRYPGVLQGLVKVMTRAKTLLEVSGVGGERTHAALTAAASGRRGNPNMKHKLTEDSAARLVQAYIALLQGDEQKVYRARRRGEVSDNAKQHLGNEFGVSPSTVLRLIKRALGDNL